MRSFRAACTFYGHFLHFPTASFFNEIAKTANYHLNPFLRLIICIQIGQEFPSYVVFEITVWSDYFWAGRISHIYLTILLCQQRSENRRIPENVKQHAPKNSDDKWVQKLTVTKTERVDLSRMGFWHRLASGMSVPKMPTVFQDVRIWLRTG